jgi:hypothetical protein
MAVLSSGVSFCALIFPPLDPPSFPSATAAGFFTFTGFGNAKMLLSVSAGIRSELRRLGTKQLCHKRLGSTTAAQIVRDRAGSPEQFQASCGSILR